MTSGLSDAEFFSLRDLLARSAGLAFDEARREALAYCVAERLRATGTASVEAYLARLSDPRERQQLLDEVTIQETHFFRNPPQVEALRRTVLPELFHAAAGRRRLRVWSAGCSTGEEPYTLAMLLSELAPPGWDVGVLGTDLSTRALAAASTARYGRRAVQLVPPADRDRFFAPGPGGTYDVRPDVRALVELRHHNLVTDPAPFRPGEVDLVLCRNVTIYFDRATTRTLVGRFRTALRDGGYLVLGHSETLWQLGGAGDQFRLVALGRGESAAFVYRRQDPPVQPSVEVRAVLPAARPVRPAADPARAVRAARSEGAYQEAIALAAAALVEDPLRADVHYLLGLSLTDTGRDAEALPALRRAVFLSPHDGFAHFLLAGVLARLGDPAAARREYAAAADALGAVPPDSSAPELDGRPVRELADLCRRLAAR